MPGRPAMEISFFPYFADFAAKVVAEWRKSPTAGAVPLDRRIEGIYDHVTGRLARERANLFYVAVTRARSDLLLIDRGSPTETEPFFRGFLDPKAGMQELGGSAGAGAALSLRPHPASRGRITLPEGLSALPVREVARDHVPSRPGSSFQRLSPSETWALLRLAQGPPPSRGPGTPWRRLRARSIKSLTTALAVGIIPAPCP